MKAWKADAVPRYNRRRKKLSPTVRLILNEEQRKILADPHRGERKKGTLADIWVVKVKAQNDQFLLAYSVDEQAGMITFWDIGQHENFYRDLERYRKRG